MATAPPTCFVFGGQIQPPSLHFLRKPFLEEQISLRKTIGQNQ